MQPARGDGTQPDIEGLQVGEDVLAEPGRNEEARRLRHQGLEGGFAPEFLEGPVQQDREVLPVDAGKGVRQVLDPEVEPPEHPFRRQAGLAADGDQQVDQGTGDFQGHGGNVKCSI